ncbi:MAG: cupin domain-containing protein [Rhodospirillales bacterium]|nr:cupin domain-containing protein [Rhodospirillales bacterium]
MNAAFTLDGTYIHLRPDESALAMEGGAKFWAGIAERRDLDRGRLMGSTDQSKDWDHWERHPAGDEVLTLLSGEMVIVLETPAGEQRATIRPGETFIVPKGLWHRGIVTAPGRLMFVTPGAGTEHKPV